MYTLKEIESKGLHYLELASSNKESKAQIVLNQGGRLSNLVFENIPILADFHPSFYKNTYASSVLFPFANRIKDGIYTFNDSKYKLDCNEVDKNNALHGLVYNKIFTCIHKELSAEAASVTLEYKNAIKTKGFPFNFNIKLTYRLSKKGIHLSVTVVNEDEKTFPFSLGWHPYFNSADINNSSVNFESSSKYTFDKQQIISGETDLDIEMPFRLKGVKLDDAYELKTNEVEFLTPEYGLKMTSTSKDNFLQLYTPDQPNTIAIEPMTGAGNNFNNTIGLQELHPNGTYKVEWNVAIKTVKNKTN